MDQEKIKDNYKNLIQKCLRFKRFRFFGIFKQEEITKAFKTKKKIFNRLNSALLRKLCDQQGVNIGCFRDIADTAFLNILNNIWFFLNKLIKFFLVNKSILPNEYDGFILEDEGKYELIFKEIQKKYSKNNLIDKVLIIFYGFGWINKKLKKVCVKNKDILKGYGSKIWGELKNLTEALSKEQINYLKIIVKDKDFELLKQNCFSYRKFKLPEADLIEEIVKNAIDYLCEVQKSLGGGKSFVIFRSLCRNARILINKESYISETINACFSEIKFDDYNELNKAILVKIGIDRFIKSIKKIGIRQVEKGIASYYLRDLVSEKNHLKLEFTINGKKKQFDTRFARYCFKTPTNANKFLYITGLILLPCVFKNEIEKELEKPRFQDSIKKEYEENFNQLLKWKEDFVTKYQGKNWHKFIEDNKKDLTNLCGSEVTHILTMFSIDQLFNGSKEEENKYKQNYGLLNELFYLKCQSQCNLSSQYLCWNKFEPKVNDEPALICSLCNISKYCLITDIPYIWGD